MSFWRRHFSSLTNNINDFVLNPLNIQQLPKTWKNHLGFNTPINGNFKNLSKRHLDLHKIPWDNVPASQPIPQIPLEPIVGKNLEEHFYRIGLLGSEWFRDEAVKISKIPLPPIPRNFSFKPNWTRYNERDEPQEIIIPEESSLVLDMEACLKYSPLPLFAIALGSSGHWYSWSSPLLFSNETFDIGNLRDLQAEMWDKLLIPLGLKNQLVIGHSVSFDRIRIREEYTVAKNNRRFLDTLSLHCAISGLSSQQRGLWKETKSTQKGLSENTIFPSEGEEEEEFPEQGAGLEVAEWVKSSSMNNLADAYELHCGQKLDKSVRDNFLVKGDLNTVRDNFQMIANYCANDVKSTFELYQKLWPKFKNEKCPHPVTFSALLEMGSYVLPVNPNKWFNYIDTCESKLHQTMKNLEDKLVSLCYERASLTSVSIEMDPWMGLLDTTPVQAQYCKPKKLKDGSVVTKPKGNEQLFGKPAWFKELWHKTGPKVTIRTQIVPYLLGMKWNQSPVHFVEKHGWCYRDEKGEIHDQGLAFSKIPHPKDDGANVGCLLSKTFFKMVDSGKLTAQSPILGELMEAMQNYSMWIGYRERIMEQLVVPSLDCPNVSIIIPSTITMGTVTRRAVEKTWMTATNAKPKIAGSELKSLVEAPPGWIFVGADVDSQELWISSLYGDAQFGIHGGSAMGWMTLQGKRADGSDLHSRTSAILGMSRDNAKIFTYGRIYGAGQKYAAQLLARFNPNMHQDEAKAKSEELYVATKGRKHHTAQKFKYYGGTESFMFNSMESVALEGDSFTPILCARISDALQMDNVNNQFMTSRVNWVIQSSAVDYLHLLLVSMRHLMQKHNISGRLALTIHDEVRFLVKEEDKFKAALALQIANLWTRSFFAQRLGMDNLPLSVAFFSAIDIDRVLRKDPLSDCLTITNGVPVMPGEMYDIYQLLDVIKEFNGSDEKASQREYREGERSIGNVRVPSFPVAPFINMSEKKILQQISDAATVTDKKGPSVTSSSDEGKKLSTRKSLRDMAEERNKKDG